MYTHIYIYLHLHIHIPLKSMLIVFEHISTLPTPRLCGPYCRPTPPLKIEPGKDNGGGHHQRWRCSQKQWGYHSINGVLTDLWMVKDHTCGIYIYIWMGINHENQKNGVPIEFAIVPGSRISQIRPLALIQKSEEEDFLHHNGSWFFQTRRENMIAESKLPLVNCPITMERSTHFQWLNQLFLWPCPIAFCLT